APQPAPSTPSSNQANPHPNPNPNSYPTTYGYRNSRGRGRGQGYRSGRGGKGRGSGRSGWVQQMQSYPNWAWWTPPPCPYPTQPMWQPSHFSSGQQFSPFPSGPAQHSSSSNQAAQTQFAGFAPPQPSAPYSGCQVNGDNSFAKVVPLVIVIPGLTSDSDSPYIKHIAYKMAKHGWNVVISNYRGLGGVPLTSDCIYTAGWTEDLREVVNHLHCTHPEAPLFAIGTSLGANILVKYLGEDGVNVPIVGAASICNPWDILIGDRFFGRGLMQRFYNRVLANALKDVARLHRVVYARIADWEGIEKVVK
ncbi:hypothetical protein M8C21_000083, partial [Ambrosia artemisiifolia]